MPLRILIAEDDPAVRNAVAELIRAEPTLELVGAAEDGAQAVELAAELQPDVAVLDVRMPRGGPDAVRGVSRASPETKILALTAQDDRQTVLQMLEAGVVGYLVKGTSVSDLVESIHRAASGQASLSVEVTSDVIDELVGELSVRTRAENRRLARERRIRRVIGDPDALEIALQPIFTLADGRVIGAEALSRFRGPPKRGPDRWFAEADEVSLRTELELVAVERALEEIAGLPAEVFLAINVSPTTFGTGRFRSLVSASQPGRIVIEVTEHAPIDDYDRANRMLGRLRDQGVRLAIDDAGAGFASLRHILRLEPSLIKLDRTLIDGIEHDRPRQALAAGMISFAAKMDAEIIAEGIEREGQLEQLVDLGVDHGQGYLLARPGPPPIPERTALAG